MHRLLSFVGQDDTDIVGHFLDHYRKLGVGEFHLFIHGDWTQADLAPLRSADVTIAGIVQRPFDVVMKSSTLEAYAKALGEGWLIIVDADEFLELPYTSLEETTEALELLGLDELPATLMQRTAVDGSLPGLAADATLDEIFPCYDYRLADRMNVRFQTWKNKYPLVHPGSSFRLSLGHHLPSTGRPAAQVPLRGILHHFKWRDRLLRSIARLRGEGSNQLEQDSYRSWLEEHDFHLPTTGLQPYSRSAMVSAGHLIQPSPSELVRLRALQEAMGAPSAHQSAHALKTLAAIPTAAAQTDQNALSYLDRRGVLAAPGRIALVSSDILGLRRSGGIGTAMSALAERLAAAGHEVQILLSPYADFPDFSPTWFRYWDARGVRVRVFKRRNGDGRVMTTQEISLVLASALADEDFDLIHFPDAGGMAAATLLLRDAGVAFQSTEIVLTVHGPTPWHRAGNYLPWAGYEAEVSHLERTSISLADVLVFPSTYMERWASQQYPGTQSARIIVPNSLSGEGRRFGRITTARRKIEKLVFFGRLELRKGIDRFITAINLVLASGQADFEVIFLGSLGQTITEAELSRLTAAWPCQVRLLVNHTSHEAVDFLRGENCLVVIPSRVDNSPYTVYECLENGIPFVASDVGGIPELVRSEDRERVLVSGEAQEYADRLLDALQNGATPALPSFSPDDADLDLLSLHGNLIEKARSSRSPGKDAAATNVSVIVYGAPPIDASLALVLRRWADQGVEILFHDNGASRHLTAGAIAPAFAESDAAALNRLAHSASQDSLLFLHVSVAPKAEALAAMLAVRRARNADAVVCGYKTWHNGEAEIIPIFAGPPEFSSSRKVYGARFFLVGKACFLDSGGFVTQPGTADILEWEFLNGLNAMGGRVQSVPSALVSVADRPASPTLSEYQAGLLTEPWTRSAPEWLHGIVRMALHAERNPGQAAGKGASRPSLGDDSAGTPSPDVRALDLAGLLAQRSRPARGPAGAGVGGVATLPAEPRAPVFAGPSLVDAGGIVPTDSRPAALMDGVDVYRSDGNELGRENIGSDGRLIRQSRTYFVDSAADAEGCDFLVAANVMDEDQCLAVAQAALELSKRTGASFLFVEELLRAFPSAAAPLVDCVPKAAALTAAFFGLAGPLYPARVKVTLLGTGTFALPQPPIAVPAVAGTLVRAEQFIGMLCLSDGIEGGETYFTALDVAVKPERGSYIGCKAQPYHEHAVLRVDAGTRQMVSVVLTTDRNEMSPLLKGIC